MITQKPMQKISLISNFQQPVDTRRAAGNNPSGTATGYFFGLSFQKWLRQAGPPEWNVKAYYKDSAM